MAVLFRHQRRAVHYSVYSGDLSIAQVNSGRSHYHDRGRLDRLQLGSNLGNRRHGELAHKRISLESISMLSMVSAESDSVVPRDEMSVWKAVIHYERTVSFVERAYRRPVPREDSLYGIPSEAWDLRRNASPTLLITNEREREP